MLLDSKHLQNSQINPWMLKTLKSYVFEVEAPSNFSKKPLNTEEI